MTQKIAILIEKSKKEAVTNLLKNHRIKFNEATLKNQAEEVVVKKIHNKNIEKGKLEHTNMIKYVQQLGYDNIPQAISKIGNGRLFRKQFLEFLAK